MGIITGSQIDSTIRDKSLKDMANKTKAEVKVLTEKANTKTAAKKKALDNVK